MRKLKLMEEEKNSGGNPNHFTNDFFDIVEEENTKLIVLGASLFSFSVGNIFVFALLANYFAFSNNTTYWFFGVFGFFVSFVLIRTGLLICPLIISDLKNLGKSSSKIRETGKRIKLGRWNLILILTRLLYFNVLNDLFIVLVVWTSLFGAIVFTGLATLKKGSFQDFASIVGIIGILSGLFQVYFQAYKEQSSKKMSTALTNYFTRISKKTSFRDFLAYLKEKDKPFLGTVEQKLQTNPLGPILKIFRDQRSGRDTTNITLNVFSENDAILSNALELSDIDKVVLKNKYAEFFKEKASETRGELDTLNVNDLKRIFLPNILFFDEAAVDLVKAHYDLEDVSEPQSFEEFRALFVRENVGYILNKISGFDEYDEKKA